MPELTQLEKLQPSLLDRLTDEDPSVSVELSEKRWITPRKLREAVIRDLEWLLNAGNFTTTGDLDEYPEVATSCLNFGIPNLGGTMLSSLDIGEMARNIKQAILQYEPRFLRHTLEVRGSVDHDAMSHNSVSFEISGDIWGQPAPFHLTAKTELELETGQVTITDYGS